MTPAEIMTRDEIVEKMAPRSRFNDVNSQEVDELCKRIATREKHPRNICEVIDGHYARDDLRLSRRMLKSLIADRNNLRGELEIMRNKIKEG